MLLSVMQSMHLNSSQTLHENADETLFSQSSSAHSCIAMEKFLQGESILILGWNRPQFRLSSG